MSTPSPTNRRRDIQLLRAIAVLLVFADHLLGAPVGGFLGVDVFFVVSGFLITGLLLREHEKTGRISLTAFFARRLKRLAPAAVLVLASTVVVSFAVFNSGRASSIRTDAVWSLFFGANWRYAATGTDYFTRDSPVSPLQHFWSLSVEEQFYIAWPLVLLALLGLGRGLGPTGRRVLVLGALSLVTVSSLAAAVILTRDNATTAYFSSFTRVWEIGAGGILALASPLLSRMDSRVRPVLGSAGLLGILVSALTVREDLGVPGPWSLAPVAATLAVLAAGTVAPGVVRTPLPLEDNRVLAYVGNISYSLYLWHFPVIIVLTALLGEGVLVTLCAIVVSTGLTVATHHLVELPAMNSPSLAPRSSRQRNAWRAWRRRVLTTYRRSGIAILAGGSTIVVVAAIVSVGSPAASVPPGLSVLEAKDDPAATQHAAGPAVSALQKSIVDAVKSASWPKTTPSFESIADESVDNGISKGAADSKYFQCASRTDSASASECAFGPAQAEHTAFMVGDSMAAYAFPGFGDFATESSSDVRIQNASMFACPFIDMDIAFDGTENRCRQHKEAVIDAIATARPDIVFVSNAYTTAKDKSGAWVSADDWNAASERQIEKIRTATGTLVILAPPPSEKNIQDCWAPSSVPRDCLSSVSKIWLQRFTADTELATRIDATLIDSRPLFCAFELCPSFIGTTPIRWDTNHVLPAADRLVWPALLELLRAQGVFIDEA